MSKFSINDVLACIDDAPAILREIAKARKITYKAIGEAAGYSQAYVGLVLNGKSSISTRFIKKIAEVVMSGNKWTPKNLSDVEKFIATNCKPRGKPVCANFGAEMACPIYKSMVFAAAGSKTALHEEHVTELFGNVSCNKRT